MSITFAAEDFRPAVYGQVVKYYLRYVLLRCAQHTDSKKKAEEIAFYAFLTTYSLVGDLKRTWQLGALLDFMVDAVGNRLAGQCEGEDEQRLKLSEPLLADRKMQDLAEALNRLDPLDRQVLVLYHLEMMSTKELSLFFGRSIAEIRTQIDIGETATAEYLAGLWQDKPSACRRQVCSLLNELGEVLDSKFGEDVGNCSWPFCAQYGHVGWLFGDCRLTGVSN
jgi:DNA-directed RNA polymerase specialized sigma24 family protein